MHFLLLSLAVFVPAMSAKPADMVSDFPREGEMWKVDLSRYRRLGKFHKTASFKSTDEMLAHVQSKTSNDDVMVRIDPEKMQELDETYVEVLSSQPLSCASVKLSCHSKSLKGSDFCHLACIQHSSYAYIMVREAKNGNVFPAVFSRHYACKQEGGKKRDCFWLTHMDELVIFPKLLIKSSTLHVHVSE